MMWSGQGGGSKSLTRLRRNMVAGMHAGKNLRPIRQFVL